MYSQAFTYEELANCLSQTELRHAHLMRDKYVRHIANCLSDSLWNGTYNFEIDKHGDMFVNNYPHNTPDYICQDLILRKLAKNLKRIYSVKFANRNKLIRQISTLLKDNTDFYVLRLDIHHFYESIDRNKLLADLNEKSRISTLSLELLNKLFAHKVIKDGSGLPRGLSISAVLSELYMKHFDLQVQKQQGVYFYARYVDDVIVFCVNKEVCDNVKQTIITELDKMRLRLNNDKTIIWYNKSKETLEYLGYTFTISNGLNVSIAPDKFNRVKTRMTRSFLQYGKNHDFDSLVLKIKYLTGNFKLKMTNANSLFPIPVGLQYSYRYLTDFEKKAKELDTFYRRILFSKNEKFGTLTVEQMQILKKMSFYPNKGDIKIWHRFSEQELRMIKNSWL